MLPVHLLRTTSQGEQHGACPKHQLSTRALHTYNLIQQLFCVE